MREYKNIIAEFFNNYTSNKIKLASLAMDIENHIDLLKALDCDDFVICSHSLREIGFPSVKNVSSLVELSILKKEEQEQKLKNIISQLSMKKTAVEKEIHIIDEILVWLTEKEKFLIENKFFNNMRWVEIANKYEQTFGYYITERSLHEHMNRIFEKVKNSLCLYD